LKGVILESAAPVHFSLRTVTFPYARTADPIASQAFSGSFKDLQEATGPKQ